jgi:glucose/arabinose dehydrogenase
LNAALAQQLQVNTIVGDPTLDKDIAKIRAAVQQAKPVAQDVKAQLGAALGASSGATQQFTRQALDELNSAMQLGELIATGPDNLVVARHGEMQAHGGAALGAINLALLSLGAGPSAPGSGPLLQAAQLQLPAGYRADIVANGLDFATAIAVAEDGTVYVAEAGFSYGNVKTAARVLRVGADGATAVVAQGFTGPIAGLAVQGGRIFVASRGIVSAVDRATGTVTDLVTGLPALGDHFTENIAVGPDGKLYFTQGTATNSGVVGLDNYLLGWLRMAPQFSDVPCRDLTLNGRSYTTGNPLTGDVTDTATTGPYQPFGTPARAGQVVKGQVKCNGAVLRVNPDGSGLEVVADGFRNPYGLAFHPDGRLFVTENGPDDRGSRPVSGPDNFYEVVQGGWRASGGGFWSTGWEASPVSGLRLGSVTGAPP